MAGFVNRKPVSIELDIEQYYCPLVLNYVSALCCRFFTLSIYIDFFMNIIVQDTSSSFIVNSDLTHLMSLNVIDEKVC